MGFQRLCSPVLRKLHEPQDGKNTLFSALQGISERLKLFNTAVDKIYYHDQAWRKRLPDARSPLMPLRRIHEIFCTLRKK